MIKYRNRVVFKLKNMNIDVMSSFKEVSCDRINGRNVVVIDVLRATSTIVTALSNKASCVIPVEEIDKAWEFHNNETENNVVLGGERDAGIIEGFHFGNSPLSYIEEEIRGKKVVLTTTNGTRAIKACQDGKALYIVSFLNVSAIVKQLIKEKEDVTIVCSGTNGKYSMDDALCAGMIISLINEEHKITTTDLGWTVKELYESYKGDVHGALKNCSHYNRLKENGYEDDVEFCLQTDIYDIIPVYKDGYINLIKEKEHD